MIGNVNYETETNVETKLVWYIGADALTEGMTVAYVRDSLLGVHGDAQLAASFGNGRYRCVDKLAVGNAADFAGVVASGGGCAADANRDNTRPIQINIVVPKDGVSVNVYTNLNCTINVTMMYPVAAQYYAGTSGTTCPWAFKALQTVNRSGTAGICQAVFLRTGNIAGTSPIIPAATVTATGTSSQANSALITTGLTLVVSDTATKGIRLPPAVAGLQCTVKNSYAGNLLVYPATDDAINAIAANGVYTMASLTSATFTAYDATTWYTTPLVAS